jgi:hypothetical protein
MDSSGGVSVNNTSVTISGTPTTAGSYPLQIESWGPGHSTGSFSNGVMYPLTITVSASAATAPTITTQPQPSTVTAGANVSFSVVAGGSPAPTYQWSKDSVVIAGATAATLSLTNVQTADAGNYAVVVTNSAGSVTSASAMLTVSTASGFPSITSQPRDLMLPTGYTGTLTVVAGGSAPLSYQWFKDGHPVSGANGASLTLSNAQLSNSGSYTVAVTNTAGSFTSNVANLVVGEASDRFINLSTRGVVGTGNNVMIAGLVVHGSTPKTILIRCVGPGLVPFGLSPGEVLADPVVTVETPAGAVLLTNDNWGDASNASILPQVFQTVGAFDLPAGSADAVALVTLAPGIYTVVASGNNGGTGVALLETYEVP